MAGTINSLPINTKGWPDLTTHNDIQDSDLFFSRRGSETEALTGSGLKEVVVDLINTSTLKPSITGTTTFTNVDNNISLLGVGSLSGLEVGDVVKVTSAANNSKEFTVDVITDSDNIIVNQAHAGGSTKKSLIDETITCTVTLLTKWYSASSSLGKGWVDVSASRSVGASYTNNSKRDISVIVSVSVAESTPTTLTVDGLPVARIAAATGVSVVSSNASATVNSGSIYSVNTGTLISWVEMM